MRNLYGVPITTVYIGRDNLVAGQLLQSIRLRWADANFLVAAAGSEGLALVEQKSPQMVFVNTDLADMFPQVLVEELRRISTVPVLVLTREADETEAVTTLDLGADDYLQLPSEPEQMAARIWAHLRRAGLVGFRNDDRGRLVSGSLSVDPISYEVFLNNQQVWLSPTEFQLLYLLVKHRGQVVSHDMMGVEIWGDRKFSPALAKKHIQRLRRQLADKAASPTWIASVYGVGYRFVGPARHQPESSHS